MNVLWHSRCPTYNVNSGAFHTIELPEPFETLPESGTTPLAEASGCDIRTSAWRKRCRCGRRARHLHEQSLYLDVWTIGSGTHRISHVTYPIVSIPAGDEPYSRTHPTHPYQGSTPLRIPPYANIVASRASLPSVMWRYVVRPFWRQAERRVSQGHLHPGSCGGYRGESNSLPRIHRSSLASVGSEFFVCILPGRCHHSSPVVTALWHRLQQVHPMQAIDPSPGAKRCWPLASIARPADLCYHCH